MKKIKDLVATATYWALFVIGLATVAVGAVSFAVMLFMIGIAVAILWMADAAAKHRGR